MHESDRYEVQRLMVEGDLTGHWCTLTFVEGSAFPLDLAEGVLDGAFASNPGVAFRLVPFGTGPNGRPGDVTPEGRLHTSDGSLCTYGKVWVTQEQADNALRFGWTRSGRTGETRDGLAMVEVENRAQAKAADAVQ